ncbi:MAG: Bax inhibitor-1/YccA family protein [Patescibacteria group bacterium]
MNIQYMKKSFVDHQVTGTALRDFLTKTYFNLFLGILAFVASTYFLIISGAAKTITLFFSNLWVSIAVILFLSLSTTFFINFTYSNKNIGMQYFGLIGYAILQSILVVPVIYSASLINPTVLPSAFFFTLALFLLLTAVVYFTGIDFGFMRSFIVFASIASLVIVIVSLLAGFNLGIFFTGFLILLACSYILYDTSNIIQNYESTKPIGAATALLGAIIMLFVNIVQFLMQFKDGN